MRTHRNPNTEERAMYQGDDEELTIADAINAAEPPSDSDEETSGEETSDDSETEDPELTALGPIDGSEDSGQAVEDQSE